MSFMFSRIGQQLIGLLMLDVFICNWLGTYLGWFPGSHLVIAIYGHALSGMKVCQYFEVKVWAP